MPTLSLSVSPLAERPIVVARRWDGLGGRLNAVINGYALAQVLDADFRFAWPAGDSGTGTAEALFSPEFLAMHRLDEAALDGCEMLTDPTEWSIGRAKDELRKAGDRAAKVGGRAAIEVSEYAATLSFRDEHHAAATARFGQAVRQIGWSPVIIELLTTMAAGFPIGQYAAIHVRAGDIVEGDWRQFLPMEKYTPRALVELAIERLLAAGVDYVLILSDNLDYGAFLRQRYDRVRRPQELIENYDSLAPVQRALVDMWMLSHGTSILGPTTSAFSRLAANVSGMPLRGTHEMFGREETGSVLRSAIERDLKRSDLPLFMGRMLVRDILWYLGIFGDKVALGDRMRLAERAVALEPDFCGALNNLATVQAFRGDRIGARTTSLRALAVAGGAQSHDDPTVESLVTAISDDVFGEAMGEKPSWTERLPFLSKKRQETLDIEPVLRGLRQRLQHCESLHPFQIHHQDVLFNLDFQISALAWLGRLAGRSREAAQASLRTRDDEFLFEVSWRLPGLLALSAPGGYPHVLRNVETVSIRLAEAIGKAVSARGKTAEHLAYCYAERDYVSPSGLRWIHGWAHDPDEQGRTAFAYSLDGEVVSGGVAYIKRPDVANALKDPSAVLSEFAFPVPVDAPDEFGELQSGISLRRKAGSVR
jgi:hypothetical protein